MDETDKLIKRWITIYMNSLTLSPARSKKILYRILSALFGSEAKYSEDRPYEVFLETQEDANSKDGKYDK